MISTSGKTKNTTWQDPHTHQCENSKMLQCFDEPSANAILQIQLPMSPNSISWIPARGGKLFVKSAFFNDQRVNVES
ncbi:hypothetical protein L1049_011099 [Liquidambar formosana]|uniref:Uncharacterized protein n=1 Tax=Liquidambar formosana TaxID=63359 RepID=A0AAP0RWC9_LIQFO